MVPEAEVGAARLCDGDEVVQGLDGGGSGEEVRYEGVALGDDAECKIEVAEEGQKLPFGAAGGAMRKFCRRSVILLSFS